jgi:hypothetical protein
MERRILGSKVGGNEMVRVLLPLSFFLSMTMAVCPHAQQQPGRATTRQGYGGFRPGFIVLEGQAAAHIPMQLVLAVDGNPNPHGWYFTAPTFEDHPVRGWWTDDGMVLDGKDGDRLSLKYMRDHSSAKPGEPLSLYVITTLSGSWSLPSGEQSLTLAMTFTRGPLENGRWYDFGASDAEIEKNARAFLHAIEDGDARAAARYVDYPLTTLLGGKRVKIRDRQEFLRLYPKIFPPGTAERVKAALPHDMFSRMGGAMVLNGKVWFSSKGAVSAFFLPTSPKATGSKKASATLGSAN